MRVKRTSVISGTVSTQELPVTEQQMANYLGGMLIQDAFPDLTPIQREFMKTGIMESEWVRIFGEPVVEQEVVVTVTVEMSPKRVTITNGKITTVIPGFGPMEVGTAVIELLTGETVAPVRNYREECKR